MIRLHLLTSLRGALVAWADEPETCRKLRRLRPGSRYTDRIDSGPFTFIRLSGALWPLLIIEAREGQP